VAGLVE